MKHFKAKLQDIEIHIKETSYDVEDLKTDLEVLKYCSKLYDDYNKIVSELNSMYEETNHDIKQVSKYVIPSKALCQRLELLEELKELIK